MDTAQIIRDIKHELRLMMNGVASTRMRESGIKYKVNFGVELPRLRTLASELPHTRELAQALWNDPVRECRILAGMIHPTESFFPETADIWVEQMHEPELAGLTVMHLFARLPFAADKAFCWIASEDDMFQLCGYLLMARLLMQGAELNESAEHEFIDQVAVGLHASSHAVKSAAQAALVKYAQQSDKNAQKAAHLLTQA